MNTYAALYLNHYAVAEPAPRSLTLQAQLVACRAYAAARGYSVQGVFANLEGGRNGHRAASGDLLELVQNWPVSSNGAEGVGDLVVIVYDGRQLLNKDGQPDPVARLIAAYGVQVRAALPPHSIPEVNTFFKPEAVQMASQTIRDLLGVPQSAPFPRPAVETVENPVSAGDDEPVDGAAWRALLDLMRDEQGLRKQISGRRAAGSSDIERREFWLQALEGAQQAEAEAEKRRIKLLDLLLDEVIDKRVLACRRAQIDVQLRGLRRERRRAHALLAAPSLSPADEELIVEIARHLTPVLADLDGGERIRAAEYLQIKSEPHDDGSTRITCMVPLVDESQRKNAEWTVRKSRGQTEQVMVIPPAQSLDTPAEDYPLDWATWPAAESPDAMNGNTAELGA